MGSLAPLVSWILGTAEMKNCGVTERIWFLSAQVYLHSLFTLTFTFEQKIKTALEGMAIPSCEVS